MQTVLIVDDDPIIAAGLAMTLERRGRRLIVCSDLESAELTIERMPVTAVITDVRLTSPFRYEGLDFITHVRKNAPASTIVLMTGAHTAALEAEALARGAAAVLAKPFDIDTLEALIPAPDSDAGDAETIHVPSIREITGGNMLFPLLQPIVQLSDESHYGYESLARCNTPSLLALPDALFDYADRKGCVAELELACIRTTFAACGNVPRLFINLHPAAIVEERLPDVLEEARAKSALRAEQVVLEITEQQPLGDSQRVAQQCGTLRALGYSFALDDVGVAYSHLTHVDQIRPKYLKVSQHFGTSFEADPTRTKIVANILALAQELGCQLVLEGIETTATRDAARTAGIGLGQGYLFGRPAAP